MLELEKPEATKDFNKEVQHALDGAIRGLLGSEVLSALYKHLKDRYDISPEEIPYQLETILHILNDELDEPGVQTIEMLTAKQLYNRFALTFLYTDDLKLQDYVQQAREELASRRSPRH